MSVIKVSCTDQVLKILQAPVVASGGVNEVKVEFDFCEKWDGFAKTALFYQDESEIYYALLDSNDTCVIPWEVCYSDGTFYFTVLGEKGEVRRTTTTLRYKVRKGVISESMMPSNPTPEVYDQIMAAIADIELAEEKTLTVELVDDTYASHGADDIREYYEKGWNVQLRVDDDCFVNLQRITLEQAVFVETKNNWSGEEEALVVNEYTIVTGKYWDKTSRVCNLNSGGNVDLTIDGETLVIAENSTATIENETLIL